MFKKNKNIYSLNFPKFDFLVNHLAFRFFFWLPALSKQYNLLVLDGIVSYDTCESYELPLIY